jgi:hypothetical protein
MEVSFGNLVLIETFNEGVKNHATITFRVDSVIEEYGADYWISWYSAPHTNLMMYWSCNDVCARMLVLMWISRWRNATLSAVGVTGWMKPRLNGKKCDVNNIQSFGTNYEYVFKPSTIFNTFDVPFFQLMHWYHVGMHVQMLLQHVMCAAIQDARLLYQFTSINMTNKTILLFVVQLQWLLAHLHNAMQFVESQPIFQRNISPPSSEFENRPN